MRRKFLVFETPFQSGGNTAYSMEKRVIKHERGKNFQGIIKYLEDKSGMDIHEQGIVTINASSYIANMKNVIDYKHDDDWQSKNIQNSWWEINFRKIKVQINGYSIKTHSASSMSGNHLKNWVIEGKNEGEEWEEIDRQDNNDLKGPLYEHYYSLKEMTKPYQYIRIKIIGKDHYYYSHNKDYYFLYFNQFEIFGEINEEA